MWSNLSRWLVFAIFSCSVAKANVALFDLIFYLSSRFQPQGLAAVAVEEEPTTHSLHIHGNKAGMLEFALFSAVNGARLWLLSLFIFNAKFSGGIPPSP